MKRVSDHLRAHLVKDIPFRIDPPPRPENSFTFDQLRANRKLIGALRYGLRFSPDKPEYDRIADAIRRLQLFQKERNAEYLVDAANIIECEFAERDHMWLPTDDGSHVQVVDRF